MTGWSIEAAGGPKCHPGFDAVWTEIDATLNFLGVPDGERSEFMAIIDSYRPQVVHA